MKHLDTKESLEQFIASASAWAHLLWRLFGASDKSPTKEPDLKPFLAHKVAAGNYQMPAASFRRARDEWVGKVSVPGWLSLQYQMDVSNFQRNISGGMALRPGEAMRPDQDPQVVSYLPEADRARVSLRWAFLGSLLADDHDCALSEHPDLRQDSTNSEWMAGKIEVLMPIDADGVPLKTFLLSVLPKVEAEASHVYFRQQALADEVDRKWHPRIWLPPGQYSLPDQASLTGQVASGVLSSGPHILTSVRHDLAGPYPLTSLFSSPDQPATDQKSPDSDPGPLL